MKVELNRWRVAEVGWKKGGEKKLMRIFIRCMSIFFKDFSFIHPAIVLNVKNLANSESSSSFPLFSLSWDISRGLIMMYRKIYSIPHLSFYCVFWNIIQYRWSCWERNDNSRMDHCNVAGNLKSSNAIPHDDLCGLKVFPSIKSAAGSSFSR